MITYPIAEIFHSVQGEGRWTGTPMMFVRLAGCNVGKYSTPALIQPPIGSGAELKLLDEHKHSICTTLDGQRFLCDTDYHVKERLTAAEIAWQWQGQKHICITGGEPLMYDLSELLEHLKACMIHIETSGTKPFPREWEWKVDQPLWITCCPKQSDDGIIPHPSIIELASEWKLLVGPQFDESLMAKLEGLDVYPEADLYLQPINGVHKVWQENLNHCLELLSRHPNWKLSAQLHKYLEVR